MNLWLEICDWVGTICLAIVIYKLIKLGIKHKLWGRRK